MQLGLSSDNYLFIVVVNNLFITTPVTKLQAYKQVKSVHIML
jgi:hypothetical protein